MIVRVLLFLLADQAKDFPILKKNKKSFVSNCFHINIKNSTGSCGILSVTLGDNTFQDLQKVCRK